MIYTLTMNPSIDYVVGISNFMAGELNRTSEEDVFPGGKGLNVSVVLKHLGIDNKAIFFAGGFTGDELVRLLEKEGVSCKALPVSNGFTRINVKIKGNKETEINGLGPNLTDEDIKRLYALLDNVKKEDYLVMCGSLPKGVSKETYACICRHMAKKGVKVILDASGEALLCSLEYKPFFIKPNLKELEEIFGVKINSKNEIVIYAKKLRKMGAANVCVSLGGDGAFLLTEDGDEIFAPAYKGKVINTVGAGDSLVAGFLAGYVWTDSYEKALKMGVAAGCASAFSEKMAEKDQIFNLINAQF